MKEIKTFPFYLLLFAAYPIISLLGANISQTHFSVLWRPLLFTWLAAVLIAFILRYFYASLHKASLATFLFLFLFFAYGHIYNLLKATEISGVLLGRHRVLTPVWILILFLGVWGIQKLKAAEKSTEILNLISFFLLLYPLYQISIYSWSDYQTQRAAKLDTENIYSKELPLGYTPDIYYIILDAYGREDFLEERFGYDNSDFLNYLREEGFYVADCAQSNYAHTSLSLTSTLNLNYLDVLTVNFSEQMDKNASLRALGHNNLTRKKLEARGYQTIAFATNFPFTEWTDANYFFSPPPTGMNSFELLLAQTSALRIPMDFISVSPEEQSTNWYRRRTVYALEYLNNDVMELPSPKFVYAHLVIPHHPFVFDAKGEKLNYQALDITDMEQYAQGYSDQVEYINSRMEELITLILQRSENPPVIILQGDHGPNDFGFSEMRMGILSAYYLPTQSDSLYPQITPVNTFRIVFNEYFNEKYPLLEDVSYYSTFENAYQFREVENSCLR